MSQAQTYAPTSLRVEPHMLPALRTAFAAAALRLDAHLTKMQYLGHLEGPWLGDADSKGLFDHYQAWVMGGAGGPFSAAQAYAQQLQRIHDQLKSSEDAYRQAEGDNAALWGRA